MANLIDDLNYAWLNNDVYKIDASDRPEGAHPGGLFGGIGVSNEPHQVLTNKAAYLKTQLDIHRFAFVLAQTFNLFGIDQNLPDSLHAPGSYLKIPVYNTTDPFTACLQWGTVNIATTVGVQPLVATHTLPFTNASLNRATWAFGTVVVNSTNAIADNTQLINAPYWVPSESHADTSKFLVVLPNTITLQAHLLWFAFGML